MVQGVGDQSFDKVALVTKGGLLEPALDNCVELWAPGIEKNLAVLGGPGAKSNNREGFSGVRGIAEVTLVIRQMIIAGVPWDVYEARHPFEI